MTLVSCKTESCMLQGVTLILEDDGTEYRCTGDCGKILRPDNPDHPNYPEPPQPEPTLDELIEQKLRDLGVIP